METKQDLLFHRLKHIGVFSSVTVQSIGREVGLTSAERRMREIVEATRLNLSDMFRFRRIPLAESKERGLVKPNHRPIAWFEVCE